MHIPAEDRDRVVCSECKQKRVRAMEGVYSILFLKLVGSLHEVHQIFTWAIHHRLRDHLGHADGGP